ncbi:hypothetical protein [Pseudomonas sp. 58 R 3]|nr:hypothetical protein [Pseudomonas sp. 58 R 3]
MDETISYLKERFKEEQVASIILKTNAQNF